MPGFFSVPEGKEGGGRPIFLPGSDSGWRLRHGFPAAFPGDAVFNLKLQRIILS
jgi:hypothetical protein